MKEVVWSKQLEMPTALKCRLPSVWREFLTCVLDHCRVRRELCVQGHILNGNVSEKINRKVQFPKGLVNFHYRVSLFLSVLYLGKVTFD
jgi:hypothetical protein